MILNEKGEEIKYQLTEDLPMSGMGGSVRRTTDGDCIKLFSFVNNIYPNYKILHQIRDLDLDSIYKIKEFLFIDGEFIGYTMKYYESNKRDIMIDNMSVFIDNMVRLYEDMMTMNDNHILMCDNCIHNTIYSKKKVIVIDCDCYKYASGYKLHDNNLRLYLDLMNELIFCSTFSHSFKNHIYCRRLFKLFNESDFNLDRNIKILSQFERPVDVLREKSLIKRI